MCKLPLMPYWLQLLLLHHKELWILLLMLELLLLKAF